MLRKLIVSGVLGLGVLGCGPDSVTYNTYPSTTGTNTPKPSTSGEDEDCGKGCYQCYVVGDQMANCYTKPNYSNDPSYKSTHQQFTDLCVEESFSKECRYCVAMNSDQCKPSQDLTPLSYCVNKGICPP